MLRYSASVKALVFLWLCCRALQLTAGRFVFSFSFDPAKLLKETVDSCCSF